MLEPDKRLISQGFQALLQKFQPLGIAVAKGNCARRIFFCPSKTGIYQ
jgi:hypothetical protein